MKTEESDVKKLLLVFSLGIESMGIESLHTEFETAAHTYEIIVKAK